MSRLGAIESTTVARSAVSTSDSEVMNSRVNGVLNLADLDAELTRLVPDVRILKRDARLARAHGPGPEFHPECARSRPSPHSRYAAQSGRGLSRPGEAHAVAVRLSPLQVAGESHARGGERCRRRGCGAGGLGLHTMPDCEGERQTARTQS